MSAPSVADAVLNTLHTLPHLILIQTYEVGATIVFISKCWGEKA